MTGRPLNVVDASEVVPEEVLNTVEAPPMSWCLFAGTVLPPTMLRPTQPDEKPVEMLVLFFEPKTFVLLNVTTLASQQIESVWVGGGGENEPGFWTVRSSRSYCVTMTSSHEPALPLKLRWNRRPALLPGPVAM